jgi:hypothetical protein
VLSTCLKELEDTIICLDELRLMISYATNRYKIAKIGLVYKNSEMVMAKIVTKPIGESMMPVKNDGV